MYKKSWDEDHLPEWATESFDYGGTFDATGAFHDSERDREPSVPDDGKEKNTSSGEVKKKEETLHEEVENTAEEELNPMESFEKRGEPPADPSKYIDFLNEREVKPNQNPNPNTAFDVAPNNNNYNGPASNPPTHIDRMKEVADFVANLIMEDDPKDVKMLHQSFLLSFQGYSRRQ